MQVNRVKGNPKVIFIEITKILTINYFNLV